MYCKMIKYFQKIMYFFVFTITLVSCDIEGADLNNEEVTNESLPADDCVAFDYSEEYQGWTIYHSFKPDDVDVSQCDTRNCDWCGDDYSAEYIDFVEIPDNSNWLQMMNILENKNESTGGSIILGELSIDEDQIDYEKKSITTKWEPKCVYYSLKYCSKKCENEASY